MFYFCFGLYSYIDTPYIHRDCNLTLNVYDIDYIIIRIDYNILNRV